LNLKIDGALKKCLYGSGAGGCSYGYADIIWQDENSKVMYVWEVKIFTKARLAQKEAQWYVDKLKLSGESAVLGWSIGGPYPVVVNGDIVAGPAPGAVIYGSPDKKEKVMQKRSVQATPQPEAEAMPGEYPGTAYQPGVGTQPLCADCGGGIQSVYAGVLAATVIAAGVAGEFAFDAGVGVVVVVTAADFALVA
jgi:hypothetical protein